MATPALAFTQSNVGAPGVICRDGVVLRENPLTRAPAARVLPIGEMVHGVSLDAGAIASDTGDMRQDRPVAVVLKDGVTAGWVQHADVRFCPPGGPVLHWRDREPMRGAAHTL